MLAEDAPVMLVDDDEDDRFLFEQAWKRAGIPNPLECVGDSRRALELLLGGGAGAPPRPRPALLLLDLKMPGLSGLELLERLRAEPALRLLPVLMLTASTAPSDVRRAYELGANAFFIKPSRVSELEELLRAVRQSWLRFTEFPPR